MLLSEVLYSSLLAYSPRGADELRRESRTWTYALKDDRHVGRPPAPATRFFVERLVQHVTSGALTGVFGDDVILVPMPGHAPWTSDRSSVSARLTVQMRLAGLGRGDARWIERAHAVPISRTLV